MLPKKLLRFQKIFFLTIIGLLSITACSKDALVDITGIQYIHTAANCYTYPAQNTVIMVNKQTELDSILHLTTCAVATNNIVDFETSTVLITRTLSPNICNAEFSHKLIANASEHKYTWQITITPYTQTPNCSDTLNKLQVLVTPKIPNSYRINTEIF